MEYTSVGKNVITACPNPDCDQLLTVKGELAEGMTALDALFKKHLAERPECQRYQDSLPSFLDVLNSLHDHECVTGPCQCVCGCRAEAGCQLVFGYKLCTSCQVDNVRGGDCEESNLSLVCSDN